MQVRFIKAGPIQGKDYKEGDTADFRDSTAKELIRLKIAAPALDAEKKAKS